MGRTVEYKTCPECGEIFEDPYPELMPRKYCSTDCEIRARHREERKAMQEKKYTAPHIIKLAVYERINDLNKEILKNEAAIKLMKGQIEQREAILEDYKNEMRQLEEYKNAATFI